MDGRGRKFGRRRVSVGMALLIQSGSSDVAEVPSLMGALRGLSCRVCGYVPRVVSVIHDSYEVEMSHDCDTEAVRSVVES